MIELYQFPVSHYCEKVRWALDYKEIPYRAHNLMPLLHIPLMASMTRQTQVPVIRLSRRLVHDSNQIVGFLEQRYPGKKPLLPADPTARQAALEWQSFCDRQIGPHLRRAAYFHVLEDPAYTRALLTQGQGLAGKAFYTLARRAITVGLRYGLKINAKSYARSMDRLNTALDRLDQALVGKDYLVGDHFSIADLTAAALLSPLVQPLQAPYPAPPGEPAAVTAWRQEFSARPSLAWVEKMYARHR